MRMKPYLVTVRATSTLVVEACDPDTARFLALHGYGAGLGSEPTVETEARPMMLTKDDIAANDEGGEVGHG